MDRRIRALRRSNLNRTEPYYKYLKPGALARLRDSRISTRSPGLTSHSQIYVHGFSSRPASPRSDGPDSFVGVIESFPFSSPKPYGPRFLQRKKLLAAKSFWTNSPSPASPPPAPPADSVADVFGYGPSKNGRY